MTRLCAYISRIALACVAVALTITPIQAAVGTTTADLLKINQGARPVGMAGVYSAIGDDAYSINYNPAGLAQVKATQAVLFHLDSLANISYEYFTFVTAMGTDSALGANLTYRHMPPIQNDPTGTLAPARAEDILGSLTYALRFEGGFRAGLTVKFLNSTLGPYPASAFAGDLGIQLDRLPFGLKVGLSVQNLGTGMTFNPDSDADSLPLFIRGGIAIRQVVDGKKDLNAGVEVFMPSDQSLKVAAGGEFWVFPDLFVVRGGYKFDWADTSLGLHNAFENYTLGCTLTRRIDGDDFSVDIAYNPANFGSTSSDTFFFGLNFKFNQLRFL